MTGQPNPRTLRLTGLPEGPAPYEFWELSVEATGEVIAKGTFPMDLDVIRLTCKLHQERIDEAIRQAAETVLVSRYPTRAMLEAGRNFFLAEHGQAARASTVYGCWLAMLDAAPANLETKENSA